VGEGFCIGRRRIPTQPHGCLVFINPYDSSKEELFTYEQDFARCGFVTVSFDGPGQGETYTRNGFRASRAAWQLYVAQAVDYAAQHHPELPIYLFGTSSGGAWALSGGSHPKVRRIAAVSPACTNEIRLPDYFLERLAFTLEPGETNILPPPSRYYQRPAFLFHGKQDVMVTDKDIHELFLKLPEGRKLLAYDGEGHCCNYKLGEIRMLSADWYKESEKERA
jgi:pimeloyl-ACP methyl ester carboxylesterase